MTLLVLVLTACGDPDPVRVAFVGTLSGPLAQLGQEAKKGFLLAVEQANAAGGVDGRRVEVAMFDDQGDPEACAQVMGQVRAQEWDYVVGPLLSSLGGAALDGTRGTETLVLSPGMSADEYSGLDDNLFRLIPAQGSLVPLFARHAKRREAGMICEVYDPRNRAYSMGLAETMRRALEREGVRVASVYALDDTSEAGLTRLARRILRQHPDGVFLALCDEDTARLARRLKTYGSDAVLYAPPWARTTRLLEVGGDAVEGLMTTDLAREVGLGMPFETFGQAYELAFGSPPSLIAAVTYEAAGVLFQAVAACGEAEPGEVRVELLSGHTFQGLDRNLAFDRYGDLDNALFLITVQNGAFTRVGLH